MTCCECYAQFLAQSERRDAETYRQIAERNTADGTCGGRHPIIRHTAGQRMAVPA